MKGALLALFIAAATVALIVDGTLRPIPSALAYAGGESLLRTPSTPEAAVENLGDQIRLQQWQKAWSSLANKAQFTEPEFVHDLTGYFLSLRTYAMLDNFEVFPLHESADGADVLMKLYWASVVGPFEESRQLHLVRQGDRWLVEWPLVKERHVPPQVIPVDYMRWDVINRGPGDDWGAQNVAAPHVRIVDMRPINRAEGVFVLGELLNDDVVPAWVSVRATLVAKNGAAIASEGSFDMILHRLLPKQVTPFLIRFPNVDLSQVDKIRMDPSAELVSASADPVIEIQNQKYNPAPDASLTGQLSSQSGEVIGFAHVLSTFYDRNGQLVWIAGQYMSRALLPQTPMDFRISVPQDLAGQVSSERTEVATFSEDSE